MWLALKMSCRLPGLVCVLPGMETLTAGALREASVPLVVFQLEDQAYAVPLQAVDRIVRAVEITPLPQGPATTHGVISVSGTLVVVLNVRNRFGLPEHTPSIHDQFILAKTPRRPVALVVDTVSGVVQCPHDRITAATSILPGLEHLRGIARLPDGMILLQDLETFFSLSEEAALDTALQSVTVSA